MDNFPDYILDALRRVGLARREYQEYASIEALKLLQDGFNAEINLPPGTGKTLISQIIGCIWLRQNDRDRRKVLCIVPTSNLLGQHFQYCQWWAGESKLCVPLEISPGWIRSKSIWHQKRAEQSDFWFAMPELFFNAVNNAYVPDDTLAHVGLVIIDEYDAFSVGLIRAEGHQFRFDKDFDKLAMRLMAHERRYLLMSATPARSSDKED